MSDGEKEIGNASSPAQCLSMVKTQCPDAKIANISSSDLIKSNSATCYCHYADSNGSIDMKEDMTEEYINCEIATTKGIKIFDFFSTVFLRL